MKCEEGDERGRSLTYKRSKSGPRFDPCGTRQTIVSGSGIIINNILLPVGKEILNPLVCKAPDTVNV